MMALIYITSVHDDVNYIMSDYDDVTPWRLLVDHVLTIAPYNDRFVDIHLLSNTAAAAHYGGLYDVRTQFVPYR